MVLQATLYFEGEAHVGKASETTTGAQESLLRSTVEIEVFGTSRIEGALRHTTVARGLGTLVRIGGEDYIMTHNHWSIAAREMAHVTLRAADGEQLLTLDAAPFRALLRYQGPGIMILAAPTDLENVTFASLGDDTGLVSGNVVWLASQGAGGDDAIGVSSAHVQKIEALETTTLLHLDGASTATVAGDSGAGIWHDGKLVGVLWAITEAPTPRSWWQWLNQTRKWQPTGQVVAIMQPLGGPSGLRASDLASDAQRYSTDEHGP